MADRLRLYLDEHVPRAVADGLRARGADVVTTSEAGLLGASDDDQLAFALTAGRLLVTQDADFLRLHARGVPHGGVLFAAQGTAVGTMIRGIMLVLDTLDGEAMRGHVEFV